MRGQKTSTSSSVETGDFAAPGRSRAWCEGRLWASLAWEQPRPPLSVPHSHGAGSTFENNYLWLLEVAKAWEPGVLTIGFSQGNPIATSFTLQTNPVKEGPHEPLVVSGSCLQRLRVLARELGPSGASCRSPKGPNGPAQPEHRNSNGVVNK